MTSEPVGREFYIPHKPVIRESAESTKLRIVYDVSAKANEKSPLLNDCLETGPSLQNLLWDVLVRNRLEVEVLRFTCALFGLVQSPFLLVGTLQYHLQSLKGRYPKEVDEILKSLYVDDLITGGKTTKEVCHLKKTAVEIFGEAGFELHKWHSNEQTLESEANSEQEDEKEDESYAKEQLGVKPGETKMLGLLWDKLKDTMAVIFPAAPPDVTK